MSSIISESYVKSIIKYYSRIQTENYQTCKSRCSFLKSSNPKFECKICKYYSVLLSHIYICAQCKLSFCYYHYVRHILMNKLAANISFNESKEGSKIRIILSAINSTPVSCFKLLRENSINASVEIRKKDGAGDQDITEEDVSKLSYLLRDDSIGAFSFYGGSINIMKGTPLEASNTRITFLPNVLEMFTHSIKKLDNLILLDLSKCNIGDEGAEKAAELLLANTSIVKLALQLCGISEKGTRSIAQSLLYNQCLHWLDLNYNRIGLEGVKYLCDTLQVNKRITKLELAFTYIGDYGIKQLADLIKSGSSRLKFLNISHNTIHHSFHVDMIEALKKDTCLKSIDYSHNYVDSSLVEMIIDLLNENKTLEEFSKRLSSPPK